MRVRTAVLVALFVAIAIAPARGVGRPGITPVACPVQTWEPMDATFEALAGAKAYFGSYSGGIYRIEIPAKWNGELMLSAHGFTTNAGPQGSRLRVGLPGIRQHLIDNGFAWAASSYRCNGYVPGMGLEDTMALVDLFTKFNNGTAPRRTYLTGGSMGGHVTLLGMHEFPTSFAGGLAMCPAGPELFDHFTAVGAAAEVITGVKFQKTDTVQQDMAKITELLGQPPNYTEKGRQLASVEINISGGPRPFAVEGLASRFIGNISGGALAGGTSPSNRAVTNSHIKCLIDEDLGLSADKLNSLAGGKPATAGQAQPRRQPSPRRHGTVRRTGSVRREDRTASAHDARHRRSLRADSPGTDPQPRRHGSREGGSAGSAHLPDSRALRIQRAGAGAGVRRSGELGAERGEAEGRQYLWRHARRRPDVHQPAAQGRSWNSTGSETLTIGDLRFGDWRFTNRLMNQ